MFRQALLIEQIKLKRGEKREWVEWMENERTPNETIRVEEKGYNLFGIVNISALFQSGKQAFWIWSNWRCNEHVLVMSACVCAWERERELVVAVNLRTLWLWFLCSFLGLSIPIWLCLETCQLWPLKYISVGGEQWSIPSLNADKQVHPLNPT